MDTATRKRILAEAASWDGTPFHAKAKLKHVGVDCGGYIHCLYSPYIHMPPFPDDYAEDWALHADKEIYLDWIAPYTREIKAPMAGGIAVFQFGRCFSHGAVVTFEHSYWHAWGRTAHGCVQKSELSFFEGRKVKYFDIKEGLVACKQPQ